MRILIVQPGPSASVYDVFVGWREALEQVGCTVASYDLNTRLVFYDNLLVETDKHADGTVSLRKALNSEQAMQMAVNGLMSACYQYWPDVVLIVSGFFVPPRMLDIIRARRTKVVLAATESPYEDGKQIQEAAHCDLALVNDPVSVDSHRQVVPTEYMPHRYRPTVHHPGPADRALASDFSFIGTGYPSRISFFEAMREAGGMDGLEVLFGGNWTTLPSDSPLKEWVINDDGEIVDNTDTAAIYRSSRIGMNLYRREAERPELAEGVACGPREIEMAACGLFFLRDPRPESDELFPMLPSFGSPEEAAELLQWWARSAHEGVREKAAAAAREAVAGRTFEAGARRLLALLDK